MQLSNQQSLPVSQQIAWNALNDTELLKECIPGCESITPTDENQYEVLITAAIGPVKARFKGKLQLADIAAPDAYTMIFDGQGGPAGHGKGKANVRLEAMGPNETLLHYDVQASVGGKIAQIGSRLVDMAAQKMAGDFFASFTEKLRERHAPAVASPMPAAEAGSAGGDGSGGLFARIAAWFRRVFGGGSAG